ncbi:MAG: NUDIX hydrolase [Myxococcales bacterium]|nr:NUDIX hydrolase [Myxococcales bacterium]
MGEIIYRDHRVALELLSLEGRDGVLRTKAVVRHPGAVVVLPLLGDQVVFVRNLRPALGVHLFELPAGTLEGDAAPEQQAARELEEETGYRAGKLVPMTSFYASPGICDEIMFGFVATELTPGPQRLQPDEDIDVVLLSWSDAMRAARDGTLRDAKSLALLLWWDRFGG